MTTTTTSAPPAPAGSSPTTAAGGDIAGSNRILGATSASAVAVHLTLAIIYVPRWPEATELVSWTALAVPLAMIAIAVAMWRTRAAGRALLGAHLVTALAVAVTYVLGNITGEAIFAEEVEMWTMIAALVTQYLVGLDVLARRAWRGVQRVLPIAGASWATVVLPIAVALGDIDGTWWPFIVWVCTGLIVNGFALAIRPSGVAAAILSPRTRPSS